MKQTFIIFVTVVKKVKKKSELTAAAALNAKMYGAEGNDDATTANTVGITRGVAWSCHTIILCEGAGIVTAMNRCDA